MKKNSILLFLVLTVFSLLGQSPAGFNYQTIIRDGNGQAVANAVIVLKMSIRAGAVDGEVVYAETHDVISNSMGLVNLKLGMGNALTGEFPEISWGTSKHFLETAVDLDGAGEFQVMGVTQFMSVPYALFSGVAAGVITMTTEERDQIDIPQVGMQIYNTTTNCLNYYTGTSWYALCGECTPPNQANAGPDQLNVTTSSVTLTANEPQNADGLWTIDGGSLGGFANPSDPNTTFYGSSGETYFLTWNITNDCGSTNDEVKISFGTFAWSCGQIYVDSRDGQAYPTVQVGDQCWMAKNMNIGDKSVSQDDNELIEKYCYDALESNCDEYGGLYEWDEMMQYSTEPGLQGICPTGWILPTSDEWSTLVAFLGGEGFAGGPLKEAGTSHWFSPNAGATNSSGFTALPGGYRTPFGGFSYMGVQHIAWLSNQNDASTSTRVILSKDIYGVITDSYDKNYAYSVRCMKGETQTSQLIVTPQNRDVTEQMGSKSFDITTELNYTVEENVEWLDVEPSGGSGNSSIIVYYDINSTNETRIGEITVIGEGGSPSVTVTVTQNGVITCGQELKDVRDGQNYPTVQIGEQCWMAKNLNIGTRIDGTTESVDNNEIEKYCNEDIESNCDVYGGLYQWDEMMNYFTQPGGNGICPYGWHLPEKSEWETLIDFLGGASLAGGELKETGTSHWQSPNAGATNSSGFTALPAGERTSSGNFVLTGNYNYYWTSSQNNEEDDDPWYTLLNYQNAYAEMVWASPTVGFSVRCIQDETSASYLDLTPDALEVELSQGTAMINVSSNVIWTVSESVSWLGVFPANGANDGVFTVNFSQNTSSEARTGEITVLSSSGEISATLAIIQQGTNASNTCGENMTDERDGQTYPTVQIGDQCWMAKNLNVGTRINSSTNSADNGTIEKYCYNNLPVNCIEYGGLYEWDEMMDYTTTAGTIGICPEGWHIPTNPEWLVLTDYLLGESAAGGALKETGFEHWVEPNNGATNSSGFTALPGGFLQSSNTFYHLGSYCYLWTSSEYSSANSNFFQLSTLYPDVYFGNYDKTGGFSLRCIKDGSATSLLEVTPANQNVNYEAGTTIFEVTSDETWTVEENVDWLTPSTLGNSGNATVTVTFDENTDLASRSGEIIFSAGEGAFTVVVTVTQVGFSPTFCGVDFVDMRNGEIYPTVKIGNQCWLGKNLNIGTFVSESENQTDNNIIEKYCYENNNLNCGEYGGLYQWNEVMNYAATPGSQGICPGGWHVPEDDEWIILEEFLGGNDIAGGKMKEAGFDHWIEPNTGATNTSGFTALPSGMRSPGGFVGVPGYSGDWWSSTQLYDPTLVWYRYLYYSHGISSRYSETKDNGFGVRCLKNEA